MNIGVDRCLGAAFIEAGERAIYRGFRPRATGIEIAHLHSRLPYVFLDKEAPNPPFRRARGKR